MTHIPRRAPTQHWPWGSSGSSITVLRWRLVRCAAPSRQMRSRAICLAHLFPLHVPDNCSNTDYQTNLSMCSTVAIQFLFHCCRPTCVPSLSSIVVIQLVFLTIVPTPAIHLSCTCFPLLSSNLCSFAAIQLVLHCCHPFVSSNLCSKSTDEVPFPEHEGYDASSDMFQRRRPWVHYKICDGGRLARGRVCAWCWSVFKMSGLFNQHDSLKAYLTYIKTDKVTRHAPFLKMLKKYEGKQQAHAELAECQSGLQELASHRTRFSRDCVLSQVLSSH